MTFTVTYRSKDGALREERIDAASRAECVAECRRRGISPTKIVEGKGANRRQDGGSPSQRRITGNAAILAAAVLAAIAGGAWWWSGGRGAAALPTEAPARPKAEKPKGSDGARPAKTPASPTENAPAAKPKATDTAPATNDVRRYAGQPVVRVDTSTNSAGMVVERLYTADGKRHRVTHFPPLLA